MDILSTFPYDNLENLKITIGKIRNGWMDITLKTLQHNLDYYVSYICDPLNDLLEATVLLLTEQSKAVCSKTHFTEKNLIENNQRKFEIVHHDTEREDIWWLLQYSNNILTIIIWKNIFSELLDTLCYYDFDSKKYEECECEEVPDLRTNLEFAFKGEPKSFAKQLENIFLQLDVKYPADKYEFKTDWGYKYSQENFKKLTDWIRRNRT